MRCVSSVRQLTNHACCTGPDTRLAPKAEWPRPTWLFFLLFHRGWRQHTVGRRDVSACFLNARRTELSSVQRRMAEDDGVAILLQNKVARVTPLSVRPCFKLRHLTRLRGIRLRRYAPLFRMSPAQRYPEGQGGTAAKTSRAMEKLWRVHRQGYFNRKDVISRCLSNAGVLFVHTDWVPVCQKRQVGSDWVPVCQKRQVGSKVG